MNRLLLSALVIIVLSFLVCMIPSTVTYTKGEAPVKVIKAVVSAYTNDPNETDDTPNITASGKRVRLGIVANNCLTFGTKVKIAGKVYIVEDRMNKRYGCNHFDIFMGLKYDALAFGRQKIDVHIDG